MMFPNKGSNVYGQQSYGAHQTYGQVFFNVCGNTIILSFLLLQVHVFLHLLFLQSGSGYPGMPISGNDVASRQQSMMGASQENEGSGYRPYPSQTPQYGGQYASLYGSSSLSNTQQVDYKT